MLMVYMTCEARHLPPRKRSCRHGRHNRLGRQRSSRTSPLPPRALNPLPLHRLPPLPNSTTTRARIPQRASTPSPHPTHNPRFPPPGPDSPSAPSPAQNGSTLHCCPSTSQPCIFSRKQPSLPLPPPSPVLARLSQPGAVTFSPRRTVGCRNSMDTRRESRGSRMWISASTTQCAFIMC